MSQQNAAVNYESTTYLLKRVSKECIAVHWRTFALSIALMLVIAGTTSFHAWLIKPALDKVFVERDHFWLIWIPIIVLLVTVIKGFATYFQLLTMNVLSMRITADLRKNLYAHFIKSDIAKLHNRSSGDMTASIMNEVSSVVGLISTIVNGSIKQVLTLVSLIAVMFYQSVELSLIAFIGFPLAAYPIYKIGRKLRNMSFKNQEIAGKFASQLNDTLQYSKLVKSYNCEDFEISRMSKVIEAMFQMSKRT